MGPTGGQAQRKASDVVRPSQNSGISAHPQQNPSLKNLATNDNPLSSPSTALRSGILQHHPDETLLKSQSFTQQPLALDQNQKTHLDLGPLRAGKTLSTDPPDPTTQTRQESVITQPKTEPEENKNKLQATTKNLGNSAPVAGAGMQLAGKIMRPAGAGLAVAGKGMDAGGTALMRAGVAMSGTGVGVPTAILGAGVKVAGTGTKALGKTTQIAGTATNAAGRNIRQSGRMLKRASRLNAIPPGAAKGLNTDRMQKLLKTSPLPLKAAGVGVGVASFLAKRKKVTRANLSILSGGASVWFGIQLPLVFLSLGALGTAYGLKTLQYSVSDTVTSVVGETVSSYINGAAGAAVSGFDKAFSSMFGFEPSTLFQPETYFYALHILVVVVGWGTLLCALIVYTLFMVDPLFGKRAALKSGSFLVAAICYILPGVNIAPWFMLWVLVVWLNPE